MAKPSCAELLRTSLCDLMDKLGSLHKTNDAEVAVCRLPAANERFFNELLEEGHGVFPSLSVVGRMQV